ncbi:MAG TPA: hypothetical protein VL095_14755, partial [Flavisolibacter sp.]|nr:hypothetical protein [Flavisolibacter sp.]
MNKLILPLTLFFQITTTAFAQNNSLPVFEAQPIEVNNGTMRNSFRNFSALTLESKTLSEFVSHKVKSSF